MQLPCSRRGQTAAVRRQERHPRAEQVRGSKVAREKDGWVKIYANLVLKGLDGDEIAYYTIANLIADPKDSESPGRLDISDRAMALLLEWHHERAGSVRKRLLQKGLLAANADGSYTINGYKETQSKGFLPADALKENRFPLGELLAFKRQQRRFRKGLKPRRSRARVATVPPPTLSGHSAATVATVPPPVATVPPPEPQSGYSPATAEAEISYKEDIKEDKEAKKKGANAPFLAAQTEASRYLFNKTGRKRWANSVQKEAFERAEAEVGFGRMKEAIDWALLSGISNIKSIVTAARKRSPPRAEGGLHRGQRQRVREPPRCHSPSRLPTDEEREASIGKPLR